ncbi:MAG: hypothetical protein QOH70_1733 [Blastocatellia bacterium]|jgi:hypothetical protein|nr:hypothetical protein [Blastocatellia bacterium]
MRAKPNEHSSGGELFLQRLMRYTCRLPFNDFCMQQGQSRKLIFILAGASVLIASLALGFATARSVMNRRSPATAPRLDRMPRVMLWAWERPVDLRFIDPKETGVAFLARTIRLRSSEVEVRPRLQPLNLPDATGVMAVARVETDKISKPALSAPQREQLAGAIVEMARLPNVSNIQIDFDATQSERAFYRDVIVDVRRRLPDTVSLSITALASWCTSDDWLSDLPIDEAVPMLFRMAADGKQIARRLDAGDDFIVPQCRHSYGVSTDEPRSGLLPARRLYVFNPDPWTAETVRAILESRE